MLEAGPARRLRDAIEPIGAHAFWNRSTNQRIREFGLDRFSGYVWGRAAALGEPPAALVVSAFAWFDPERLTAAYETARARIQRDELIRFRSQTTSDSLDSILSGENLEPVLASLRQGLAAAPAAGRPLFAGLSAQAWPEPAAGRLWRACDLLREHRGDSHIAAAISAGLEAAEMSVLTELWLDIPAGAYSASRRWSSERLAAALRSLEARGLVADGALTDSGRELRDEIERRTDAMEQPIIDAIGAGLDAALVQLGAWSERVIAAGAFTPDPRKRAAG